MKKNLVLGVVMAMMMTPIGIEADELETQKIQITASEYQFTMSQDSLKAMTPVVLTLFNKGKMIHEFESQLFYGGETKVESDGVTVVGDEIGEIKMAPGKTVTIFFVPRNKGKIEFLCNAKEPVKHLDQGMKGVITIQ